MSTELTEEQLQFLRTYVRLEEALYRDGKHRGPSLNEILPLTDYSDRSGAQKMREKLIELGYIRGRRVIEAGSTAKAKRALGKSNGSGQR